MTNIPTSDAVSSTAISTEGWVAAIIKGLLDGLDDAGPIVREKLDAILREQDLVVSHEIDYNGDATVAGPMGRPHKIPITVHVVGVHKVSFKLEKRT